MATTDTYIMFLFLMVENKKILSLWDKEEWKND